MIKIQLAGQERIAARKALLELVAAVEDMILKEERILFPMTLQMLSDADWKRCRLGEEEIGYAFGAASTRWMSQFPGCFRKAYIDRLSISKPGFNSGSMMRPAYALPRPSERTHAVY